MADSFRHKGLRKQLVEELRGKGIKDNKVFFADVFGNFNKTDKRNQET